MRLLGTIALVTLLTVSVSPAYGAKEPGMHRTLLQDASIQDAGASVQALPSTNPLGVETAATAAFPSTSAYAPDAQGASVGEAMAPVTASAADIAAASAVGGRSSRRASRRPTILKVPGTGLGAAAAVVPAQTSTITLYEHCNYGGTALVAAVGNYPSLPSSFDNFISSVRVPAGLSVTLRADTNYLGRGLTINGPSDIACLVSYNFNDITSSMRIVSTSSSGGGDTGTGGFDTQLLTLVNAERAKNGLRSLSINTLLNAAAQAHSQDQARMQSMSHTGSDGSTLGVRITRAGYRWSRAGENVAAGFSSAQSVFNAWNGSAGHRANMLGNYVHMGVGVATGGNGWMYWTQVFATPA